MSNILLIRDIAFWPDRPNLQAVIHVKSYVLNKQLPVHAVQVAHERKHW